ncbi:signal peptidase II [Streptomyces hoynatensis]|uniref:signal peptidase II n=1 Tax=Streptomyces hoynatensis TaxID=1141874 RepID=UPI0026878FF3
MTDATNPTQAAPAAHATDVADVADVPDAADRGRGAGAGARGEGGAARRRVPLLLAVAGLAYAIDLGTKLAVVARLEHHAPVGLIGSWMELRVMRNSGAAFGIGGATTLVFTVIAIGVAAVIFRLARRLYSRPWALALGLLLGGALGNLTDRLFRAPGDLQGAVVDFIAVRGFSVMNLADWAIVCGGALIVLFSFCGWELDGTTRGGATPAGAAPVPGPRAEAGPARPGDGRGPGA